MPEYFVNLKNPKEGDTVNWKDLELHVPEGFRKHLNSMEKHRLLNGQLAEYGLMLGDNYGEYSELIRMKSMPAPLEKSASNRLREYLTLFDAEQRKNRYKSIEKTEISRQIDGVINHICETVKNEYVPVNLLPPMTHGLAALITARSKDSFKTCELVEELKKREGVEEITVEPYATKQITVDGPAVILKIID